MRVPRGFSLIELMIVVATVGVLASVAVATYQTYLVRAKVSEVILAASAGKSSIAAAAATLGGMPTTAQGSVQSQASRWVESVRYTSGSPASGVIVAIAAGDPNIAGLTLSLTGTYDAATGQIAWACTSSIPPKFLPSSCK